MKHLVSMVLDDTAHENTFKHLIVDGTVVGVTSHLARSLLNIHSPPTLLSKFIEAHKERVNYK